MWTKFKNWVILNIHTPEVYKTLAKKGIVQNLVDRGLLSELKEADYIIDYKNHVAKYCLQSALLFAKAGRVKMLHKKATPFVIDVSILNRTIMIMLDKDLELFMRGN